LHGSDARKKHSNLRQGVQWQLNETYANKKFLDLHVRSLLMQDPEPHAATRSLQVNLNWLRMNNPPIIKEKIRKVRRLALKGVHSIRTYFSPVQKPSTEP
jgi:hypothetical protein